MQSQGLKTFHWTRAKGGRFSLKKLQHATIAHVILVNGYKPESTVLFIDAFNGNYNESQFLISEYLHQRGFKIPKKNIHICGGGDKCIPIINFADLLAFQIGLHLNERYKKHNPNNKSFPFEPQEIPFDEKRVLISISNKGRDTLETLLKQW